MDDGASVASGDGLAEDDGGDYKPGARAGRGGARRSDFGVAGGGAGAAGDNKLVKPKKIKQHNLTSGTFSIPPIPRNADGSIRLPTSVGIMQIKSLGTVDTRDGFHTERYIFPVGFEATRRYPSMVDRTGTTEYTCRITDGGDGNPRFELHPSDQPGVVISSGTPTGAWTQVVKATNKLRERNHSNSVSGPDYYGLSHNVVKAMIQELPGADQVPGYIWQHFVE
ncbi:F/Y rich C-terminus-domain-containing protein, partial [Rhodotorula diobovata]